MGRGRGRGRARGGRGSSTPFSDDDEPAVPSAGTTCGSSRGKITGHCFGQGADLTYQHTVPTFLRQYSHLLEKGDRPRREPRADVEDDAADHDDGNADATLRALEDNPDIQTDLNEAQVKQLKADAAKERGNDAFKARDYEGALQHYNEAINLDNANAMIYSNRSAVHAQLENWDQAREDARTCVNLRGTWAKGWVRLGHALCGLEEWTEAKEALSRARELEPDDKAIEKAWQKADYEERQVQHAGRVIFKQRTSWKRPPIKGEQHGSGVTTVGRSKAARTAKKAAVSFGESDNDQSDDNG